MANTKLIPREHWAGYFDSVSKRFLRDGQPEIATIAVTSRLAGDRTAVHGARVVGITYDRHDDVLDVALDGVDHLVYPPTEIRVIEDTDGFVRELMVKHKGAPREVSTRAKPSFRRRRKPKRERRGRPRGDGPTTPRALSLRHRVQGEDSALRVEALSDAVAAGHVHRPGEHLAA